MQPKNVARNIAGHLVHDILTVFYSHSKMLVDIQDNNVLVTLTDTIPCFRII